MTSHQVIERLRAIGTATISTQLLKRGIRRHWIAGAKPLLSSEAVAGPAFTLRFMAGREDVSTIDSLARPGGLADAVEAAPPGSMLVIEAQANRDSGLLGDILCDRLRIRGVSAAVTDGVMRDMPGLRRVGWPIWGAGLAAPAATLSLYFAGFGEPVGIGGVAVFPGDPVIADEDGAVVVPAGLAEELADDAHAQDCFEQWVIAEVARGRPVAGFYPPTPQSRAEYEAVLASKEDG